MHTFHWDEEVPHVGFFAKRDIQPNEELTYIRDSSDKKAPLNCGCGLPDCAKTL